MSKTVTGGTNAETSNDVSPEEYLTDIQTLGNSKNVPSEEKILVSESELETIVQKMVNKILKDEQS